VKRISDYEGSLLNHLEGFYRAEDRDLALELMQALDLPTEEIRFTENSRPVLAVHPNADDKDPTNNVLFLYVMPEPLRQVVDLIERKIAEDPELRETVGAFRELAEKAPPIMPHFGLRYRSEARLQVAMDRLEQELSPALKARVSVFEVPRYAPVKGLPDIRQVFVRTNVIAVGAAGFEQAIELQAERGS
jgi:hypothetical protein